MRRAGLITLLGVGAAAYPLAPALGSCAPPPPLRKAIRDAPAVFVGTVVDLENGRRWATVDVVDVWKGSGLGDRVEVRAGPEGTNVASSDDRHFKLSRDYLFVPYERNGRVFRDGVCSSTTLFRPSLTRFRRVPLNQQSPSPEARASEEDAGPQSGESSSPLIVGLVILAASAMGFVIYQRRSI